VIIAILTGAELGGVLGMFIAVPIAGIIRVLIKRFVHPKDPMPTLQPTIAVEFPPTQPTTPGVDL
jgi:predicted PurR-regulated permease PerM